MHIYTTNIHTVCSRLCFCNYRPPFCPHSWILSNIYHLLNCHHRYLLSVHFYEPLDIWNTICLNKISLWIYSFDISPQVHKYHQNVLRRRAQRWRNDHYNFTYRQRPAVVLGTSVTPTSYCNSLLMPAQAWSSLSLDSFCHQ